MISADLAQFFNVHGEPNGRRGHRAVEGRRETDQPDVSSADGDLGMRRLNPWPSGSQPGYRLSVGVQAI
jgi:hypothetical protein